MGRPLNKKYFGNRNIGTNGGVTSDDKIGGEGLAAYSLAVQKGVVNITNTYKYFPALSIPAPDLPGGIPATATVVWEINAITLSSGGSGYTINQSGVAIDQLLGSIWTDASTTPGITISTDGTGAVTAATLGANRGEWTTIDGTGITTWGIKLGAATTAQLTITFRLKSITTLNKGSGYVSVPTLSWTRASSQTAGGQTQTGTPTVALTTDSGGYDGNAARNVTGNQENAILIYAYLKAVDGGSSSVIGDIVKQQGSRTYKVRTAQGTGVVKLVAAAPGAGEATIAATDYNGNTYYVTKITNHKALLTRDTQNGSNAWVYATGDSARWTFSAAAGTDKTAVNTTVQVANA
jgi:hypothetical protein